MKGKWLAIFLVLAMVLTWAVSIGATSSDVTVTAQPAYVAITNDPGTWTLNGITGSGKIATDVIYYSNPLGDTTAPAGANVVDGECRFTVTNSATVAIDLTVNCGNFAGGDANMTNSNDGSNGATAYGAYSWASGAAYPGGKVVMKSAASSVMKDALAALTNIKWGAEIETQTDAWAGGNASTATMTITATAD